MKQIWKVVPRWHPDFRLSAQLLAQIGICVISVLVFVASAAATVQAPQTASPAAPVPLRQPNPSRTTSPTATVSQMRALPTRTLPRAALAPRAVPGQPQVDANTIALYHFDTSDTVAVDATGNYTGTLHGNALITDTGLYAGVLRLDGNSSYVQTGYLGNMPQGTIEAFIDFSEACNSNYFTILSAGGDFGSGQPVMVIRQQMGLMFGIYSNGEWHWANSGINACRYLTQQSGPLWPYETWRFHHVAGTWGPRGMEIWVDGVLHGVGTNALDADIRPYKYMCNPQMQMGIGDEPPNPLYPVCRTPVPAPTMPAYPPGDYMGGLPSYNTFLIGCGADGSCFKGRIDEVRISNIQRTFQSAVVPTVTPIPTQTPVPIMGEYTTDSNTLALYHLNTRSQWMLFDEVTQSWNAGLAGNATIVPGGRFDQALWFDGNSSYAQLPGRGASNGTVEMWFNLSSIPTHAAIFSASDINRVDQLYLGFSAWFGNTLVFIVWDNGGGQYAVDSGFRPTIGCWHHVAGTWGTRGLQIWVDGTLRGTYGFFGAPSSFISRELAGCNSGMGCVSGLVDEVRISSVQRTFTRSTSSYRVQSRSISPGSPSAPVGDGVLYLPWIGVAPTPQFTATPTCPN